MDDMKEGNPMNLSKKDQHSQTASQVRPDFHLENNPLNVIRRSIAIISGKGGVGKSLVASLLATGLQRSGQYRVGILDADITGPSIPRMFGVGKSKPQATEFGLFPVRSLGNIQLMSINFLLEEPESPVVWRGPILASTVKQFWTDVIWGDLDFLILDMPPGTGDVPLTVFQSIPLDGIILVTSPQDLVSMIVKKAVNMARMMAIPILGLIENMSHAVCPHCGELINLFGESTSRDIAAKWGIPYLGSLPIDPELARLCDEGTIEQINFDYLPEAIHMLKNVPSRINPNLPADFDAAQAKVQPDQATAANTRKIAVAAAGESVCEHFGHCEGFMIYRTEAGKIVSQEFLPNPGHKPGLLPNLLNDNGVQVIIAGGMGGGAQDIFNEKGIEVITGAGGTLAQTIQRYLQGDLASSGSVCHEHRHAAQD
jgi:Mrp family chromosome partitioning ATPase/predicted Fe-Mo cluster-binding NifX family protein